MTGLELAGAVLEVIGIASPLDGAPNDADVQLVLRHANLHRKQWNAKGLALFATERQALVWTANEASRTVGPSGADITGTMPPAVLVAKVIPAGQTYEVAIDVMTQPQYAAITNKAQTSTFFTRVLYEKTDPTFGTLTVWPVPTSAPTLVIHNKVRIGAITDVTDIEVSEEGELALTYALAKPMASVFGKAWTREQEDVRREAWGTYQRANARMPEEKTMPAGFPGGRRVTATKANFDSGLA